MEGGSKDKCSAFMALGDYTHDGKICCAHNSFDNFIDGQNFNNILDITPTNGHRMLFQCAPGYISSQTDFFINSKGFMEQKPPLEDLTFIDMVSPLHVGYEIVCNMPIL